MFRGNLAEAETGFSLLNFRTKREEVFHDRRCCDYRRMRFHRRNQGEFSGGLRGLAARMLHLSFATCCQHFEAAFRFGCGQRRTRNQTKHRRYKQYRNDYQSDDELCSFHSDECGS